MRDGKEHDREVEAETRDWRRRRSQGRSCQWREAIGREEEDRITDILTILLTQGSNWIKLNSLRT